MRNNEKIRRGAQSNLLGPAGLGMLFVVYCLLLGMIPPVTAEEQHVLDQAPVRQSADSSPEKSSRSSLDEAIEKARQKVTADPTSEEAQTSLGYLFLKKGSFEEAEKAFDQALSLNARYHAALTGKGIVLTRLGEDEAAEEMLQKALLLNPNPVRTYYELGYLYEKKGDFEKALIEYKKGLEKYRQGRR